MGQRPRAKPGKISQRGQIDAEWRKTLTPEEFRVTREQRAFSHRYYQEKRAGMYNCICYGAPLFSSQTRYDSGTDWPSFYAPAEASTRIAPYVVPDGPNPTGMRYCINGAVLKHDADKKSGNSSR